VIDANGVIYIERWSVQEGRTFGFGVMVHVGPVLEPKKTCRVAMSGRCERH
jgi:hypothetical protein